MSNRQFSEWMAFYALEPRGERRADLRAARAAQGIARHTAQHRGQIRLDDFLLTFDKPKPPQTEQEMAAIIDWVARRQWQSQASKQS